MRPFDKYYRVLEIPIGASDQEIKKAYRSMAKKYHPDRSHTVGTREQFIRINEAYEILMRKDQYVLEAIQRYQKKYGGVQRTAHPDPAYGAGSKERAAAYADMRFKEFEKTAIYKTAVVFNSFFNYLMILIGLTMVFSPVVRYFGIEGSFQSKLTNHPILILPFVLGVGFLLGLWHFVFKND